MQTIKLWKYCWYLVFFIIFSLLIVKIYVSFLFWKKNAFNIVHFPNLEISASLYLVHPSNKYCTSWFQNLRSAGGAIYIYIYRVLISNREFHKLCTTISEVLDGFSISDIKYVKDLPVYKKISSFEFSIAYCIGQILLPIFRRWRSLAWLW